MSLLERLLATSKTLLHVVVGSDGSVRAASPALRDRLGVPEDAIPGVPVQSLLAPDERSRVASWQSGDVAAEPVTVRFQTARGASVPTRCVVASRTDGIELLGELENTLETTSVEELTRLNNELAVLARQRAQEGRTLKRARSRAEASLAELEASFWHLRKVQEVLPFCMGCGKVRTGQDTWLPFVEYLRENDILVSHAFCPPCGDDWARREGFEEDLADR